MQAIRDFKLRPPDWHDVTQAWKWLKEGRYRPMVAVLIMATIDFCWRKARKLWGKVQHDLLKQAVMQVNPSMETHRILRSGPYGHCIGRRTTDTSRKEY